MFGSYRTILALCVVLQHLGPLDVIGGYAVFGFYTLSGYLMTMVLHDYYGYTVEGIQKYVINRGLRIFPAYWFSIALSVALLFWLGDEVVSLYHEKMYLPHDVDSVVRNLFLLLSHKSEPRLTPPSWALTVEFFFYLCLAVGMTKTKKTTGVFLTIGFIYTAVVNAVDTPWALKYFVLPAAMLPFTTGAMIYFYKDKIHLYTYLLNHSYSPIILIGLFFLNYYAFFGTAYDKSIGFYLSFVINVLLICSLSAQQTLLFIPERVDRFIGGLSYPIYLLHFQAGLILMQIVDLKRGDLSFVIYTIPMIIVCAWLFSILIERPVNILRDRVKNA